MSETKLDMPRLRVFATRLVLTDSEAEAVIAAFPALLAAAEERDRYAAALQEISDKCPGTTLIWHIAQDALAGKAGAK